MRKYLILVSLAGLGMLQAGCEQFGCDSMYSGRGNGGPDYFEGAPYYGGHRYYREPENKGDSYYGDKDIGIPYCLVGDVMYYKIGGCYCYYRNHMRYYVSAIPEGGRYFHVGGDGKYVVEPQSRQTVGGSAPTGSASLHAPVSAPPR